MARAFGFVSAVQWCKRSPLLFFLHFSFSTGIFITSLFIRHLFPKPQRSFVVSMQLGPTGRPRQRGPSTHSQWLRLSPARRRPQVLGSKKNATLRWTVRLVRIFWVDGHDGARIPARRAARGRRGHRPGWDGWGGASPAKPVPQDMTSPRFTLQNPIRSQKI